MSQHSNKRKKLEKHEGTNTQGEWRLTQSNEGWREHIVPTILSIVTQSLQIHGHNYSLESIFLIRNIARMRGIPADRTARFVRSEFSLWNYRKSGNYFLDYHFPIVHNEDVSHAIKDMHNTIRLMHKTVSDFQINQDSLVYEIKGTKKYVANTWMRCEIVALAYEIMSFILLPVVDLDTTFHDKEDKENCVLEFTHDVMVLEGGNRTAAIAFLHKLCVCFGSDDVEEVREMQIQDLLTFWSEREGDGPEKFTNGILSWSKSIVGNDLEREVIANSFHVMFRYLTKRRNSLKMSLFHFNERKDTPSSARQTKRKSSLSNKEAKLVFDQWMRRDWWNFLSTKVYRMYIDGESNRVQILKAQLVETIGRPNAPQMKKDHMAISKWAFSKLERRKSPAGNKSNKRKLPTKAAQLRSQPQTSSKKKMLESGSANGQVSEPQAVVEKLNRIDNEENGPDGSEEESEGEESDGEESECEESEGEEEGEEAGSGQELEQNVEAETMQSVRNLSKDLDEADDVSVTPGHNDDEDVSDAGSAFDSEYSFETVRNDNRTTIGFRLASTKDREAILVDYVFEEELGGMMRQIYYVEFCDQMLSIRDEFDTRHGPRFTSYGSFAREKDNTLTETCLRNGIAHFKTTNIVGTRLMAGAPIPQPLINMAERLGVVDPVVVMNFLVRQSGSKVYGSNISTLSNLEGRVRHLKVYVTDLPDDMGLLLKGPFLYEVSKIAQYLWAAHKHYHAADSPERMEVAKESSKLRKILVLDPVREPMGFSEATVEMFEACGDIEWDSSVKFYNERYPDRYEWTMMMTTAYVREIDNRVFHVCYKFHYSKVTVFGTN